MFSLQIIKSVWVKRWIFTENISDNIFDTKELNDVLYMLNLQEGRDNQE